MSCRQPKSIIFRDDVRVGCESKLPDYFGPRRQRWLRTEFGTYGEAGIRQGGGKGQGRGLAMFNPCCQHWLLRASRVSYAGGVKVGDRFVTPPLAFSYF